VSNFLDIKILIFCLQPKDTLVKCRYKSKREREKKMFANMIVLNTVAELTEFLNHNDLPSLVNRVAFAGDLLDRVRNSGYDGISIDEEIGFCDDGGWIGIDEMGYVVNDMYLP
jgi:hypothetical protein